MPSVTPGSRPYDLDALEFQVVRTLLSERLASPIGRSAVDALGPCADLEVAQAGLRAVEQLVPRLQGTQSLPLTGAVEVRSWLQPFFAGEHSLQDAAALCRAASTVRESLTSFIDFLPVCHAPDTILELVEGSDLRVIDGRCDGLNQLRL